MEYHMQCRWKAAEFFAIATASKVKTEKHIQAISWQKPPVGWMKLNTDGVAHDNAWGGGGVEEYLEMNTTTRSMGLLEIMGR